MKRLISVFVLAAVLLGGCATAEPAEPSETAAPIQITEAPTEPVTLLSSTDGSVSTYALDSGSCAEILPLGQSLAVLTTDGLMYLLSGDELAVENTRDLGCRLSPGDPSIVVMDDQLSYFDTQRNAYVTLGKNLTEISARTIQDDMTAGPLMSPELTSIYYCTDTAVRVMDIATGNSRLLRQEHQNIVSLDGLLFDGTILRYTRMISGDRSETCFIRTTDGSQVYLAGFRGELTTWEDSYAAVMSMELPIEDYRRILTGSLDSAPQVMDIGSDWTEVLFPGDGTLLVQLRSDSGLNLSLYDLRTGTLAAQTSFDGRTEAFPYAWKDGERIWLWEETQGRFYRWSYTQNAAQGESLLLAQSSLTSPDESAMDQVEQQRQTMEQTYGIPIRIAEDDNRTAGIDYSRYPDYRPEQYALALDALSEAMSHFPEGFFSRLENAAIELVDDFDPAEEYYGGTGSLQIGEETRIRVSICRNLTPIFYHELFHAMELELQSKTNRLSGWEDLNPKDLEYVGSYADDENAAAASAFLAPGENAVADGYCLVSAREDRAQTFMYAMMPNEESRFRSDVMQSKLSLLSEAIRRAFDWREAEEVFPWEQYLSE